MINSENEVNAITPVYIVKLDFIIQKTDIGTQKINGLFLVTYGIVLASFLVQNKFRKVWFFEESFLLADTSMKIVPRMFFLTLSNVDVQFVEKKIIWRGYTITKALSTINKVELIDKKKFAATALDKNAKTFVVHIVTLSIAPTLVMQVYPSWWAQVRLLLADKAPIEVLSKYSDYINVFSFDFAM